MRCFLAVLLIFNLCGCGGAPFQGTFRSNTQLSITGVVLFIDFVPILNRPFAITSITFLPDFTPATTVAFCGDLTQQLFPNDFATVTFTQGPTCATVLTIFLDCCRKSAKHDCANQSLLDSADGSMATVATRREKTLSNQNIDEST